MPKKLTIGECNAKAKENGGKCLTKVYNNTKTKMLWECKNGHCWSTKFSHIKSGHWCRKCFVAKNIKSLKLVGGIEKAKSFAVKKGGICLSKKYTNTHTHMLWQCEFKHTWSATFANIKRGYWCPNCAGQVVSINDCRMVANKNGGKCLAKVYNNAKTKMSWECGCGHKWMARYNDIQQGKWCPLCATSKTQRLLFNIVQKIYPLYSIKFNYRGFDWLKSENKNRKQELDICIPEIKLAIEYDGKQHFMPVRFGGISDKQAKENFRNVKKLDKLKNKKVLLHSEDIRYFVRFNYKEELTENYIRAKIVKCGVKL